MRKLMTLEDVVSSMYRLILKRGNDFRYADESGNGACAYVPLFHEFAPHTVKSDPAMNAHLTGCAVGEILSMNDLMNKDIANSVQTFEWLMETDFIDADLTREAAEFLTLIQLRQDRGNTWADAFTTACERFNIVFP